MQKSAAFNAMWPNCHIVYKMKPREKFSLCFIDCSLSRLKVANSVRDVGKFKERYISGQPRGVLRELEHPHQVKKIIAENSRQKAKLTPVGH